MTDYRRYPGGKGHEWRGEWDRRLLDILGSLGFKRLTDFAQSRPTATLEELVAEIGVGDVAPIQLKWKFVEEAKASGTQEQCARDLLVRELRQVKAGWPSDHSLDAQEDVLDVLIAWNGSLQDERYDSILKQITRALLDANDIPAGWHPSGTDDPIIAKVFERYWPHETG